MNDPIERLREALDDIAHAWQTSPTGERTALGDLTGSDLVAVNDALGTLRRRLDAVHAGVANEIARQSTPDLGSDGLAKKNGFRSPAVLIAATTGTSVGDATRLVSVGEATAPRRTFSGADAPPRHPFIASALAAGRIGTAAASAIITMLDRVATRVDRPALDAAERALADQAPGLSLDQLAKVITRTEAHLDPGELELKESELRAQRSLTMFERAGMLTLNLKIDAATGAPIKVAIDALVTAEFRRAREVAQGGGSAIGLPSDGGGAVATPDDGALTPGRTHGAPGLGDGHTLLSVGDGIAASTSAATESDPDAPHRSITQRRADALVQIAEHMLGCDSADKPVDGATVVVRVDLADLESGTGLGTIDGVDQPVSIATVRRMAAAGGVIPCVLDSEGEILDWGRTKRLFTRAQKLAITERDGGCAMCGLPPGMTKVHHIRWWARDNGPTDLSNGVLLCETCHHRIHDNGWEIRIEGRGVRARVWFIPPPHVDARRRPRLGGNARFSYSGTAPGDAHDAHSTPPPGSAAVAAAATSASAARATLANGTAATAASAGTGAAPSAGTGAGRVRPERPW